MRPGCLKIDGIIRRAKWAISTNLPQNVVNRGSKDAFNSPYVRGVIGAPEARSGESTPELHNPDVYLWERASGRISAKSLERVLVGDS